MYRFIEETPGKKKENHAILGNTKGLEKNVRNPLKGEPPTTGVLRHLDTIKAPEGKGSGREDGAEP